MPKKLEKPSHAFTLQLMETASKVRSAWALSCPDDHSKTGYWELLQQLRADGPETVANIARMRGVSRQYIQKLADGMAGEKLIRFVKNPGHKRSPHMQITQKGMQHLRRQTRVLHTLAETLADGVPARDLKTALRVIRQIREAFE